MKSQSSFFRMFSFFLLSLFLCASFGGFFLCCNEGPADSSDDSSDDDPPDDPDPTASELVAEQYDEFEKAVTRRDIDDMSTILSIDYRFNGKNYAYQLSSYAYSFSAYEGPKITFTNTYNELDASRVRVHEKSQWRGDFIETDGTVMDSIERDVLWQKESDETWRLIGNQDPQWSWYFEGNGQQELHSVETADGKRLCLTRYTPRGNERFSRPLVLCHGIAANRFTFDLSETYSLAQTLADRGFDIWMVELRGHGRSYFPDTWDAPSYDWNVESYIVYDVPAVIAYVKEHTQSESVFWIGHSMGGMVVYGHILHSVFENFDSGIEGLITIGSPGYIDFKNTGTLFSPGWIFDYLIRNVDSFISSYPYLFNLESYTNLLNLLVLLGVSENELLSMIWNPANMTDDAVEILVHDGAHNMCGDELRAFRDFYLEKSFFTPDRSIIYADNYHLLTLPLLIINGSGDEIGVTDTVKSVFDKSTSQDRMYRQYGVSGREIIVNGTDRSEIVTHDTTDYGHLDLVVGIHSPLEVYPLITDWLIQRNPQGIARRCFRAGPGI